MEKWTKKSCLKCGVVLYANLDNFHRRGNGYHSYCKSCRNTAAAVAHLRRKERKAALQMDEALDFVA